MHDNASQSFVPADEQVAVKPTPAGASATIDSTALKIRRRQHLDYL